MGVLKKFMEPVDMTEGSPWQKIILFAVPMLVGNIAQQLYNTVDSVVVGNYVGGQCAGGGGKRRADPQSADRAFCGNQCGSGYHGVAVFRRQGAGEAVYYHRQLHHADGDRHFVCHDSGLYGGKAAAGASGYAGLDH